MPPYGSLGSPSLRKMERGYNDGGSARRFNFSHIIGDPFALATISIGILAWLIAFVSSLIADLRGSFPNFAWWGLVYTFFCILGILITVATAAEQTYSVAIVGYLAAALVFTTSAVNSLIYSSDGAKEAAAAGFILLSMVAIVWIFYYGSAPNASGRHYVDSFALHKGAPSRTSRSMSYAPQTRPDTTIAPPAPQMYTSAQLNGFETSSPVSGYPGGPFGSNTQPLNNNNSSSDKRTSSQPRFGASPLQPPPQQQMQQQADPEVSAPTEYPYRAKAIYSYEANPDDANEISFAKHEILEVSDVSGRWWQAKKEGGETGIAPSNYLILL